MVLEIILSDDAEENEALAKILNSFSKTKIYSIAKHIYKKPTSPNLAYRLYRLYRLC